MNSEEFLNSDLKNGVDRGAMERYNRAMGSEAHVRASEGLSRPRRGATDPEILGAPVILMKLL